MLDPVWVALVVLLVLDVLAVLTRAAMLNARPPDLVMLQEQHPIAERVMAWIERPRLRVSLRLGVIAVHFLAGLLAWVIVLRLAPAGSSWIYVYLALFLLVVVLAEFGMEGIVLSNPELWSVRLAWFGVLLDTLLAPLSSLLVTLLRRGDARRATPVVTESELRTWAQEGRGEGSLEQGERQMIYSIFQFGDTLAREIMVPRIDMLALEIHTTLAEAMTALAESGHSRVPVFVETVDNIVGLLYAKDLLAVPVNGGDPLETIRDRLRPAYFVPEAKKVDELLTEMQVQRFHLAIVVDEYGGVAGLVTLEDIMEEIIGEIQDEYDQAEEMLYQQINPDEYIFQGRIDLGDFNDVMGVRLSKDTADTLGGFIYGEIGRVPLGGESVQAEGLLLTVEQVIGRRIRKVHARRLQPTEQPEEQPDHADR